MQADYKTPNKTVSGGGSQTLRPKTVGQYPLNPEENEVAFIASPSPAMLVASPEVQQKARFSSEMLIESTNTNKRCTQPIQRNL